MDERMKREAGNITVSSVSVRGCTGTTGTSSDRDPGYRIWWTREV